MMMGILVVICRSFLFVLLGIRQVILTFLRLSHAFTPPGLSINAGQHQLMPDAPYVSKRVNPTLCNIFAHFYPHALVEPTNSAIH